MNKAELSWVGNRVVAVSRQRPRYCRALPFHPSDRFPEWSGALCGSDDNPAYRGVRECLFHLGLDSDNYDTPCWNPLGEIIQPGETVVVKPNWVAHRNHGERSHGLTDTDCLISHGSVIRAVLDYVAKALEGRGKIIVCDSPIQGTDWEPLMVLAGTREVVNAMKQEWPGLTVEIGDLRLTRAVLRGERVIGRVTAPSQAARYREVDLGSSSLLVPLMGEGYSFGVTQYPRSRMMRAHCPDFNAYLLPRDVLEADVLVNIPKMKTHAKAGITGALKNLVGLVGMKDYLPHFRYGSPSRGGDEYPDGPWLWNLRWHLAHKDWERDAGLAKTVWSVLGSAASVIGASCGIPRQRYGMGGGGWYGNDTLWRTILDLNRAVLYYDRAYSVVAEHPTRPIRYIAVMDGLIAGHREAPLAPTPLATGLVLAALNPVALDAVAAALMGFDIAGIKQINEAFQVETYRLADFGPEKIRIAGPGGISTLEDVYRNGPCGPFEPSLGWRGRIEHASIARE